VRKSKLILTRGKGNPESGDSIGAGCETGEGRAGGGTAGVKKAAGCEGAVAIMPGSKGDGIFRGGRCSISGSHYFIGQLSCELFGEGALRGA
jgi:hypothetical protein